MEGFGRLRTLVEGFGGSWHTWYELPPQYLVGGRGVWNRRGRRRKNLLGGFNTPSDSAS